MRQARSRRATPRARRRRPDGSGRRRTPRRRSRPRALRAGRPAGRRRRHPIRTRGAPGRRLADARTRPCHHRTSCHAHGSPRYPTLACASNTGHPRARRAPERGYVTFPVRCRRGRRHPYSRKGRSVRRAPTDIPAGAAMSAPENWRFETKQIHSGAQPDPVTKARATPIYQTTSYVFDNADARREPVRAGRVRQHLHAHPEPDAGRRRGARRRARGRHRRAARSRRGQAAETLAVLNIAEAGDHIVSSSSIYGGTYNLFKYTLAEARHRGHVRREPGRPRRVARAPCARTRSSSSPRRSATRRSTSSTSRCVADVAHEAGVPLIVDNTIATPYLIRPFEHGADIVVHSATKFLGGHGTVIGGVIVDGGNVRVVQERRQVPRPHRARPALPRRRATRPRSATAWPTSSRPACSCCATSAPRSRRSTPGCSSRASRRCRCASSGTCRTPRRSPSGSRTTPTSPR